MSKITGIDNELAEMCKALGHPARVQIIRHLLQAGECQTGTLVNQLPLAQSTVSQHLKLLRESGWIDGEIDGPRRCYCVNPHRLELFKKLVTGFDANKK